MQICFSQKKLNIIAF